MERLYTFVETTDFQQSIPELFGDDDEYRAFQAFLCKIPTAGEVIRGTGGVRKVRWADTARQRGKRGGIRVIYYFVAAHDHIFLVLGYGKNEKDDLTPRELAIIGQRARTYREELGVRKSSRARKKETP